MADRVSSGSPASDFSLTLLLGLVRAGVRDIVLSPGSRSQALALAAAEIERRGLARLHVRIDERGAGFLAVGLARESGLPAAVVTTSGTAVANLHPAVLEAHHAGVPLIALTADRPAELRGIRSNQTTVQPGIFPGAVRLEHDVPAPVGEPGETDAAGELAAEAFAAAVGTDRAGLAVADPGPGPVHLNIALREPLSAPIPASALAEGGVPAPVRGVGRADSRPPAYEVPHGPRTVVIAGAGAGAEAEEFARAGGWPLIAEVASGARFGPNLVVSYRELLGDPGYGGRVERVIVFGHPTLSREVPALVRRSGVEAVVVAPCGFEWYDPARAADRFERAVHVAPREQTTEERAWLGGWVHASRAILEEARAEHRFSGVVDGGHVGDFVAQREYVRSELDAVRAPVTRRMLVDAVWAATWPHDRLVLGASRLIRDADRSVRGKRITVHANRGLSGIDGTIATAFGVAIASQAEAGRPGVTRALLGDLTLLHDAGSMLIGAGERRPRLQLVVGNDGGGSIFDALEVAGTAAPEVFERVQFTPQSVDLAALAAAYGWDYSRAATKGELDQALTAPLDGPAILEVPLPR